MVLETIREEKEQVIGEQGTDWRGVVSKKNKRDRVESVRALRQEKAIHHPRFLLSLLH
jgi:hypothetical protein